MSEFDDYVVGSFDGEDVITKKDGDGQHWFTRTLASKLLGLTPASITRLCEKVPNEIVLTKDYKLIKLNGRSNIVYSLEAFVTICELATTPRARQFRQWLRRNFRAGWAGDTTIIDHVKDDNKYANMPTEMTPSALAYRCGWISHNGLPHGQAVLLALLNNNYHGRDLMRQILSYHQPSKSTKPIWVISESGVSEFIEEIDVYRYSGEPFTIAPNKLARLLGQRNKFYVIKIMNDDQ